jgi:thiol-disulfide isomerase/thioredoxin
VLIRQNGPVFGSSNPYSQPGETQLNVSTRNLRSTDHYNGTVEQVQRHTLDSYVVNLQHAIDVTITHTFTERFSASIGVPIIAASWSIPSPTTGGEAARATQHGRGVGDISVSARGWVLPPDRFTSGNVSVGLGVKMPTGDSAVKDVYPDITGANVKQRFVDQSVQPGDGGWGLIVELAGFKDIPHGQLFGQASYLANPRDRNKTLSVAYNISPLANPAINPDGTSYNSVPDQYVVRLGAAVPLGRTGFVTTLAWHAEGLPRYDLIGDSHGFRRPGVEMFLEPGFSYAKGRSVFSFSVPLAYYRNRFRNPYTGNAGDATFPNQIFLASYGHRFGKKQSNTSILANRAPTAVTPEARTGSSPGSPAAAAPATTSVIGNRFKPFKLKTIDGERRTLADVRGSKATLVIFFYPRCPYCSAEAPAIQRLADSYKPRGLSVVYINILPEEDTLVRGWQVEHGDSVPVLVGASPSSIEHDYLVAATPTQYLLDATGHILATHSGFQPGDEKTLEEEVKTAIGIRHPVR